MTKTRIILVMTVGLLIMMFSCIKTTEPKSQVATPTFNPPGGSYTSARTVSILCATSGATIRYTTDGTEPTEMSTGYTAPIVISQNTTLKAKAFKSGWESSQTSSGVYIIGQIQTVTTPTFNPPSGFYASPQSVRISCSTSGATIRYTTNGSTPSETSAIYINQINVSSNTTLKARAFLSGWTASGVATAEYGISSVDMVQVQGGSYNLSTHYRATLSSYFMGKYEITQRIYQSIMGHNPSQGFGVGDNHPVYYVSWFDAIEFCNRLSISDGLTPVYSYSSYGTNPNSWPANWKMNDNNQSNVSLNASANGYRLPTEAEWEFAARGGVPAIQGGTFNHSYSGSNSLGDVGWFRPLLGGGPTGTNPVGRKNPNELGIYDMSGNVWEWCWDRYNNYPSGNYNNPTGPVTGTQRVNRGGSWNYLAAWCAVDYRGDDYPTHKYYDVGFRVVRNAQ